MDKKILSIGALVIISSMIWGAVILGCAYALKGTGGYDKIQNILAAGAAIHLIVVWGPASMLFMKIKELKSEGSPKETS